MIKSALIQRKGLFILIPILAIIIFGGFFLIKSRSSQKEGALTGTPAPSASHFTLPETKEERAEVTLTPRYDKKAVVLKISKIPIDVTSVDYELSYEAKGGLPRGVLGKVDIKGQESILREILLGTCSRNVCVYDEGVKKVSLTLKFNKTGGASTGFAQEYEL